MLRTFQRSSALIPLCLLALLFFAIPIEHKYDKLFRHFSLTLIPSGLELPRGFDKKIYFYISDLIALLLFAWGLMQYGARLFADWGVRLLGIVFACAFISIALSPIFHYPLPYFRLWQLFTPFALYAVLSTGVSHQRIFCWILLFGGLFQSLVAILQTICQHPLGLRLLGEKTSDSILGVPHGKIWCFDWFHTPTEIIIRSIGTLPHTNVLAGFLALTLLMTMFLFYSAKRHRTWFALAYSIQCIALATTYSRSAIYGLVLSTIFWLVWMRPFAKVRSVVLLVTISVALCGALFHEQYIARGGIVNYAHSSAQSDQFRLTMQKKAVEVVQKKPLNGVGYHLYGYATHAANPHNMYLTLLAETGPLSLAAFLGWICIILWRALRGEKTPELGIWLAAFGMFLFIGLCESYPLYFQQGKLMFFLAAGMTAALTARSKIIESFRERVG